MVASTSTPKSSGPQTAPVKLPVMVMPVAAPGADGFDLTTARWNSPGHANEVANAKGMAA